MRAPRSIPLLRVIAIGAFAVGMPAACFYPDYSFNEAEATGSGGGVTGTTTTDTTSTTGTMTTTTGTMTTTTGTMTTTTGGGEGGMGGNGGNGGGTTSTTSTTTTSTSTSSGMGGSGGSLGPEDCLNDVDDDGDGLIDCADPQCVPGYTCAPNPPATWTGYYMLYDGPIGGAMGCTNSYPDASPFEGFKNLVAPPATCSACGCSAPQGQTCPQWPATVDVLDATCAGSPFCGGGWTPTPGSPPWNTACVNATAADTHTCGVNGGPMCDSGSANCNVSVIVGPLSPVGGTCTASGGTPTIQPATWSNFGRACSNAGVTGLGCGVGQVCVPKTTAPFESGVCIKKAGVNSCSGQFQEQHVLYDGFTDTRACSGCSCGGVANATCGGTLEVYSGSNCLGTKLATVPMPSGCSDLSAPGSNIASMKSLPTGPNGGSCPASGGQPSGAATPQTPTTFCCIP